MISSMGSSSFQQGSFSGLSSLALSKPVWGNFSVLCRPLNVTSAFWSSKFSSSPEFLKALGTELDLVYSGWLLPASSFCRQSESGATDDPFKFWSAAMLQTRLPEFLPDCEAWLLCRLLMIYSMIFCLSFCFWYSRSVTWRQQSSMNSLALILISTRELLRMRPRLNLNCFILRSVQLGYAGRGGRKMEKGGSYCNLTVGIKLEVSNYSTHININKMPKTLIVHIDHNYPFALSKQSRVAPNTLVKIKRTIPNSELSKELLAKLEYIRNLHSKYLIKILAIDSTAQATEITYEYAEPMDVPRNALYWKKIIPQLKSLALYLSNIGLKTRLTEDRLCMINERDMKYYLGLDFQLGVAEDGATLYTHYEQHIAQIKNKYIGRHETEDRDYEIVEASHFAPDHSNQNYYYDKMRKASLATIPSKFPAHLAINKEISHIKNSVKEITQQFHYGNEEKEVSRRQRATEKIFENGGKFTAYAAIHQEANFKKELTRKYSGDTKAFMFMGRKMSAKYSDFKSEINKPIDGNDKALSRINANSPVKTRMEEMKYQQYIEITSSKKKYLKDFISVLEDDHGDNRNQMDQEIGSAKDNQIACNPQMSSALAIRTDAESLKFKAQQSIKNSLQLIKKIKGAC